MSSINYTLLAKVAKAAPSKIYLQPGTEEVALLEAGLISIDEADQDASGGYAATLTEAGNAAHNENPGEGETTKVTGFGSGFGGNSVADVKQNVGVSSSAAATNETATTAAAKSARASRGVPVMGGFNPADVTPAKTARAVGERKPAYPFASLVGPGEREDGQLDAFFVADVPGEKRRIETMKSAVSSAKREFAEVSGTKPSTIRPGTQQNVYKIVRDFVIVDKPGNDGTPGAWIVRTA